MDSPALPQADFTGALYLRCPKALPSAIKQAARQNMTSVSSYIRTAVLSQLKRDGCAPKDAA
jgi:predicted HicB family RNase H-like nuclease